ncbi:MAG: hypothetical protein AAF944_21395 [Bacteroidota bacterium]
MNKLKFYQYATGGLLLLNLIVITFFLFTKPRPPHRPEQVGQRAIDIMRLDDKQHELFLQSVDQHKQQMSRFNNQQRDLLRTYFSSLLDSTNIANSDSLIKQVQVLERKKIEATYQHFQDINSTLKPDQQAGFESFVNQSVQRILTGNKNNPPPPKDS